MDRSPPTPPARTTPLLQVDGWTSPPGRDAPRPASFGVGPGLTLVTGGEGAGKTTLLRAIAGEVAPPPPARLARRAPTVHRFDPAQPAVDDPRTAREWLAARRAAAPAWDAAEEAALLEAFALGPHLDKTSFMMSTGTRRKLALVAAFACGATLVLLDVPFAALDATARGALAARLAEAAHDGARGWLLADYALPAALEGVPLAGTVDLGD